MSCDGANGACRRRSQSCLHPGAVNWSICGRAHESSRSALCVSQRKKCEPAAHPSATIAGSDRVHRWLHGDASWRIASCVLFSSVHPMTLVGPPAPAAVHSPSPAMSSSSISRSSPLGVGDERARGELAIGCIPTSSPGELPPSRGAAPGQTEYRGILTTSQCASETRLPSVFAAMSPSSGRAGGRMRRALAFPGLGASRRRLAWSRSAHQPLEVVLARSCLRVD